MPIISIKNLSKTYKTYKRKEGLAEAFKSLFKREYVEKQALKSISLDIDEGEILGFIGPNGAGKSTAIKIMCGILFPDSGEVKIMKYVPWIDRIKYVQNVGVVFGQKSQLWWDLPALDSFYLMKAIYGVPKKTFERRLKEMIDILDLTDISKMPVRNMSLGERMKCELVAALLHNPKIVFLDEPTIGVDLIAKDKIHKFIRHLNKKYKTTFIVTTHDMGDIEKLCERIVIINHGEIIYDGLISDIKQKYIQKKFVSAKLKEAGEPFKLEGCRVASQRKDSLDVEVDLKKQRVSKVITYLMRTYSILDANIADPPIEEIIKEIYLSE